MMLRTSERLELCLLVIPPGIVRLKPSRAKVITYLPGGRNASR